jgi:hypothetical protein
MAATTIMPLADVVSADRAGEATVTMSDGTFKITLLVTYRLYQNY